MRKGKQGRRVMKKGRKRRKERRQQQGYERTMEKRSEGDTRKIKETREEERQLIKSHVINRQQVTISHYRRKKIE